MSRFFINSNSVDHGSGIVSITGEDVKHIGSVLRAAPGDMLELCDGEGTDYDVEIEQIAKESITARIIGSRPNRTEPPVDVTLFQGIPKADKMDYIIQKCTELGVKSIIPVMTARTVVKFANRKDSDSKVTRWRRIALEAAKQCDRGIIPEVGEPIGFSDAVKLAGRFNLSLFPYEEESGGSLGRQLKQFSASRAEDKPASIAVFIGPEGGFTSAEAEQAVEGGFVSVTLGPRILRTETAGMAVSAIIMYELGDMGLNG